MKNNIIAMAMGVCMVSVAAGSFADTLVMRDGSRVEGTVVGIASRTITFRHADGVTRRYTTSQVEALEFLSAERANPHAVNGGRLDAPAGTELVVRTVEMIDSRKREADQNFSAIVEEDSTHSGHVIVPARSSVQLVIRQVSSGGTTGSPELVLDVHSITIDGRRYLVSTTDIMPANGTGTGRNRRTAETVGSGAALGTVVGAIAGGGEGAAIAGQVEAAGGAGAPILTRGRDVHVPAQTVLTFRLDKAVTLQAAP